jgi:DNA polymerase-3 subunit epsilon
MSTACNRIVVFDTETTGLDIARDRVIEIGAVVLDGFHEIDKVQYYFNPGCSVSKGAFQVHGLSDEFLSQFEPFCCNKIKDLFQDSVLVAHNASFDMKFLNKEFGLAKLPEISNTVIDTLSLARKTFPGAPANLDALCNRFKISNAHRDLHGALVDALLLARVYNSLRNHGIMQLSFEGASKSVKNVISDHTVVVNDVECARHEAMCQEFGIHHN